MDKQIAAEAHKFASNVAEKSEGQLEKAAAQALVPGGFISELAEERAKLSPAQYNQFVSAVNKELNVSLPGFSIEGNDLAAINNPKRSASGMDISIRVENQDHWVLRAHGNSATESLAVVQSGDTSTMHMGDGRTLVRQVNPDRTSNISGKGNAAGDNFKGTKSVDGDFHIVYADGQESNKVPFLN